jgi:hypothetical protein
MRTTFARAHRDQTGLVGKFIVGWLLLVALLGIAAVDGASIAFTTLRLSDMASTAASDAAAGYAGHREERRACDAAARTVERQDPAVKLVSCQVDPTGVATVKIRKTASTLLVGRLEFLRSYGRVTRTESAGRG